jgi:hypothetical protein
MRRFRLNGWQRVGIVLSVAWAILVLVGVTLGVIQDHDNLSDCLKSADPLMNYCRQRWQVPWSTYLGMTLVGLAPIPIAWFLVYGLVGLVRWIRRGFAPST